MQRHDDPWLIELLSRSVFRIENGPGPCPDLPAPCFAYAKINVEDIKSTKTLTDSGFFIADTNISFISETPRHEITPDITVRAATPEDEASVREIAETSFTVTRFHADPNIENTLADKIKSEWAGNFFTGNRGDEMWLAEKDGRVIGFNQVLVKNDTATIDLIAVDQNHQRLGAARAMIGALQERYKTVRVGTQLANKNSIALYEKMGFHFESAQYVLHYHGA